MSLDGLPTPSLLLDRSILDRNIARMSRKMSERGVALRPHLKTAKSAEVARRATAGQPGGITVSTLAEAGYFLDRGFRDITYAVGIVPSKLAAAAALMRRGAALKVVTDNLDAATAIAGHGEAGVRFPVLIEVDCGEGRAGVPPVDKALLEIARVLHAGPGSELAGVLTHGGHSYAADGAAAIRAVARQERDAVVDAAERIRAIGLPCKTVSAGSTPTAVMGEDFDGLTEMRPGVFVFFDLDQLARGVCRPDDLALSVLASVIGHRRDKGHLILDAGALALSKDISAQARRAEVGYGQVCPADGGGTPGSSLYVARVSQEHGIVPVADPADFARLPVGSRVRILPNHACLTAAAYDRYRVVEAGNVVGEWDRINGW